MTLCLPLLWLQPLPAASPRVEESIIGKETEKGETKMTRKKEREYERE